MAKLFETISQEHSWNSDPCHPEGESKLTAAALLRHDAVQGTATMEGEEDAAARTTKTFDTFASDWSGCTNVAFDKVLLLLPSSPSPLPLLVPLSPYP